MKNKKMIKDKIEKKIKDAIFPEFLEIIDESFKHASHYDPARNDQTHFLIIIHASYLESLSILEKHKKIYQILAEEIRLIHAISLKFKKDPL